MFEEAGAAGAIQRGNITYLPVVPGRIEFAWHVRRYLLEHRPRIIALQLPASLEDQYAAALERMPRMSVILIADPESEEDDAAYIPVEPGDPFSEALRAASDIAAE